MRHPLRFGFPLLAIICLLAPTHPLVGQESPGTPISKIERKNQAPLSSEVLRVNLPRPVEAKLKNGLTVLIAEDHRFPAISVQLQISAAGALFEPAELPGL